MLAQINYMDKNPFSISLLSFGYMSTNLLQERICGGHVHGPTSLPLPLQNRGVPSYEADEKQDQRQPTLSKTCLLSSPTQEIHR